MFLGMFILIWSGVNGAGGEGSWWNAEAKLATTFTICFAIVAILFLGGSISIYSWDGKDDRDRDD